MAETWASLNAKAGAPSSPTQKTPSSWDALNAAAKARPAFIPPTPPPKRSFLSKFGDAAKQDLQKVNQAVGRTKPVLDFIDRISKYDPARFIGKRLGQAEGETIVNSVRETARLGREGASLAKNPQATRTQKIGNAASTAAAAVGTLISPVAGLFEGAARLGPSEEQQRRINPIGMFFADKIDAIPVSPNMQPVAGPFKEIAKSIVHFGSGGVADLAKGVNASFEEAGAVGSAVGERALELTPGLTKTQKDDLREAARAWGNLVGMAVFGGATAHGVLDKPLPTKIGEDLPPTVKGAKAIPTIEDLKGSKTNLPEKISPESAKPITENPLFAEARKYKSAEEFVKAREYSNGGDILYHGSSQPLTAIDSQRPLSLATTSEFAKSYGPDVATVQIKPNSKILDLDLTDQKAPKLQDFTGYAGVKIDLLKQLYGEGKAHMLQSEGDRSGLLKNLGTYDPIIKYAKQNGYDAVRLRSSNSGGSKMDTEIMAINPDKFKVVSKSQLTSIYKEAHAQIEPKASPQEEIKYAKNLQQDLTEREIQAREKIANSAQEKADNLAWEKVMTTESARMPEYADPELQKTFNGFKKGLAYYLRKGEYGDFAWLEKVKPELAKSIDDATVHERAISGESVGRSADDLLDEFYKKVEDRTKTNAKLKELRQQAREAEAETKQAEKSAKLSEAKKEVVKTEAYQDATRKIIEAKKELPPETKTSGVAKSIEAKAIKEGLTENGFDEKAGYSPAVKEEQAQMISDFMKRDIEAAKRAATTGTEIPADMRPEALFTAMRNYAMETRDGKLVMELANSPIATEISAAGSKLSLSAGAGGDATAQIRDITRTREKAAEKRLRGKSSTRVKSEIRKSIDSAIKKARPSVKDWKSFIDTITC